VEKPEGRRPLERPRRRWVDNIRMDLQEVGCVYMDWIGLACTYLFIHTKGMAHFRIPPPMPPHVLVDFVVFPPSMAEV